MTECKSFSEFTTEEKWRKIGTMMDAIQTMEHTHSLRSRYNTNHSEEQRREETRAVRARQYTDWLFVKDLYGAHRDELANTCGNALFEQCKRILEQIFTQELDEALREIVDK